jgi:hypothetical protein
MFVVNKKKFIQQIVVENILLRITCLKIDFYIIKKVIYVLFASELRIICTNQYFSICSCCFQLQSERELLLPSF